MYQVLITTYIGSTYGNAVSTVVVGFERSDVADSVVTRINNRPHINNVMYRSAERLNDRV